MHSLVRNRWLIGILLMLLQLTLLPRGGGMGCTLGLGRTDTCCCTSDAVASAGRTAHPRMPRTAPAAGVGRDTARADLQRSCCGGHAAAESVRVAGAGALLEPVSEPVDGSPADDTLSGARGLAGSAGDGSVERVGSRPGDEEPIPRDRSCSCRGDVSLPLGGTRLGRSEVDERARTAAMLAPRSPVVNSATADRQPPRLRPPDTPSPEAHTRPVRIVFGVFLI